MGERGEERITIVEKGGVKTREWKMARVVDR